MSKKILLIDDDKDIHEHIRIIMEKAGYQFSSAFNGNDGLEKIISEKPDLIILDFMMPKKNGSETFEEFLTHSRYRNFRNIPVIMLTAISQSQDEIKRLLQRGLNAYLEKPFGHKELLNIIENTFVTNEIKIRNNKLKKAIENAKNFLENLIASCPVAIITTDIEGKITFINKGAEDILGYRSDEILKISFNSLLLSGKNFHMEMLNNINPFTPMVTKELYIKSKYGKGIPMGITYSYLKDHNENVLGLLVVGQDLTNQKRLEKELLEKERLTAITEALATINHKINNPLTPIIGNIQLLRKDENQFQESHIKKLEIIELNAKKIFNIIQKFNQITSPIRKKYYGKTHMLDI
ncbi:MAG: response regulator [bacterium]